MTSPLPDVGVVIPVFNRAGLVRLCLESVRAQTSLPAEIVVVDDGSTDETPSVVEAWIAEHAGAVRARLLRQANRGASAARNAGLAALGPVPFVAFLDSDDTWPADFLSRALAALAGDPGAVAASADRLMEDLGEGSRRIDDAAALAEKPVSWIFRHGGGVGSCTVFRAEAVRQAGGYPKQVATGHDSVLFCRIAGLGRWLHCPGAPVTFLRNHAKATGQDDHLCKRFPDHERTWTQIYDALAQELGPARLDEAVRRRTLARLWHRAGRSMARLGRVSDARECYRRALDHRPWSRRAWWGWLRMSVLRTISP